MGVKPKLIDLLRFLDYSFAWGMAAIRQLEERKLPRFCY